MSKEKTDIVPAETKAIPVAMGQRGLVLKDMDETWRAAQMIVRSGLAPRSFHKAEQVMVAIMYGAELGLAPMQSLNSLIVINGKVSMYGETARALVESHPDCKGIVDDYAKDDINGLACTVTVHREGREAPVVRTFSQADADAAGLWAKAGPWTQYPKRMLYCRALGFALRDAFPDVLRGIKTAEELQDYPTNGIQSGDTVPPADLDQVAETIDAEETEADVIDITPEDQAESLAETLKDARDPKPKPELFEKGDIPF